jgi:hypothetical protein
MRERFDDFWDQIPAISGKQEISGLQFCALASVAIQETSGDFWANPERVGNAEHPGLAYAFDRIPGLKASYNTLAGNRTALHLFNDDIFRKAHGHRPGAIQPGKVDQEWEGDTWPVGVSVKVDPEVNGFIMQADFYKFRGRGVIQTTGRSNYKALINFLLSDEAAPHLNPGLSELVARWRDAADAQGPDKLLEQVATLSSNEDWDLAFAEPMVLAAGIRLHSKANRDYLDLSADARVLNQEARVPGSLYNMARSINAGGYASHVVLMMRMMIRTFADIAGPAAMVAGTTNGAKVLRV